jgi:hypothetical protein
MSMRGGPGRKGRLADSRQRQELKFSSKMAFRRHDEAERNCIDEIDIIGSKVGTWYIGKLCAWLLITQTPSHLDPSA